MRIHGWAGVLWLLAAPGAWAGQYVLLAGQTNTVPVAARVLNGEQVCNLQITVPGQAPFERVVRAPFFEARISLSPSSTDSVTVRWEGQHSRANGAVVNACPTQGETSFKVVRDNTLHRAVWSGMLAQLAPAKAECVGTALAHEQVRPDWYDFTDPQVSADDARIERAFAQCDVFLAQKKAWGTQNPKGHACKVGGLATRCEGFYTARINGKVQNISQAAAIQRQLDNLPWSTGVREIAAVRASRIQQEKDRVAELAAQEAAKRQAVEDARLLAEQQAKDAKAAEQRALQEKIAALRAQIAADKERAAQEKNWLFKQVDKLTGKAPDEGGTPGQTAAPGASATHPAPAAPQAPAASPAPAAMPPTPEAAPAAPAPQPPAS